MSLGRHNDNGNRIRTSAGPPERCPLCGQPLEYVELTQRAKAAAPTASDEATALRLFAKTAAKIRTEESKTIALLLCVFPLAGGLLLVDIGIVFSCYRYSLFWIVGAAAILAVSMLWTLVHAWRLFPALRKAAQCTASPSRVVRSFLLALKHREWETAFAFVASPPEETISTTNPSAHAPVSLPVSLLDVLPDLESFTAYQLKAILEYGPNVGGTEEGLKVECLGLKPKLGKLVTKNVDAHTAIVLVPFRFQFSLPSSPSTTSGWSNSFVVLKAICAFALKGHLGHWYLLAGNIIPVHWCPKVKMLPVLHQDR